MWLGGCAAPAPAPEPVPPPPAFTRGEAALLLDDYAAAAVAFAEARDGAGDDGETAAACSYWIGVCRRKLQDLEGAAAAFAQALTAREPAVAARTRVQLGHLAWEAHRWLEAREMYSAAAQNPAVLTTDVLLTARRRAAQAAIRSGDWADGRLRMATWGPSDEPREWSFVRRLANDGQFACLLGPLTALEAETKVQELADRRRPTEVWSAGAAMWVVVRPFDDWAAAEAEARLWREANVPGAALP